MEWCFLLVAHDDSWGEMDPFEGTCPRTEKTLLSIEWPLGSGGLQVAGGYGSPKGR